MQQIIHIFVKRIYKLYKLKNVLIAHMIKIISHIIIIHLTRSFSLPNIIINLNLI